MWSSDSIVYSSVVYLSTESPLSSFLAFATQQLERRGEAKGDKPGRCSFEHKGCSLHLNVRSRPFTLRCLSYTQAETAEIVVFIDKGGRWPQPCGAHCWCGVHVKRESGESNVPSSRALTFRPNPLSCYFRPVH